jgi:hypothetical protein
MRVCTSLVEGFNANYHPPRRMAQRPVCSDFDLRLQRSVMAGPVTASDPRPRNGLLSVLPGLHGISSCVCNAATAVIAPVPVNRRSRPKSGHREIRLKAVAR